MEIAALERELPPAVHAKLERIALWVVQVLEELTTALRVGPDKVKIPAMPKSAVRHTQGLAILRKTKKGFVLNSTTERAFVINKITEADGSVRWSAPVFMHGGSFGVGCTLGFMTSYTCYALMNDKAVQTATTGRGDWGCNWNFLLDMNGSRLKKVTFDSAAAPSQVVTDRYGGMIAKYYKVDAALVDMSMRGGRFHPNWKLNYAVYGPDVDLQEVLAGKVPPPPEFQPVYDLLNQFIADSAPPQKIERRGSRHGGRGLSEMEEVGGGSGGRRSTIQLPQENGNGSTGSGGSSLPPRRASPPGMPQPPSR